MYEQTRTRKVFLTFINKLIIDLKEANETKLLVQITLRYKVY